LTPIVFEAIVLFRVYSYFEVDWPIVTTWTENNYCQNIANYSDELLLIALSDGLLR